MKLIDPTIKAAKPRDKKYSLADGKGLSLWVMPTGAKWWRYRYYYQGKEKMLSLGVYPDKSLRQARTEHMAAKELLSKGIDPSIDRQEKKQQTLVAKENSFESVARQWWDHWQHDKKKKHAHDVIRRFEVYVFPVIGFAPINDLTAQSIVMTVKRTDSSDIARRALNNISQVMRYAVANGLAERNSAMDIKPADVLRPHRIKNYARLDVRELPELLQKMNSYNGQPLTRYAMQLMALTFVRTSELIKARWDEIDGNVWRISPERMKMKTLHIVPLSRQSIMVIENIRQFSGDDPLLFPSESRGGRSMSNNTILKALRVMGYHKLMTGHGFRGLASTILHEQGYNHDHIELQLAHSPRDAVSAAYNYATYLEDRAKMMQEWANYLDSLR